MFRTFLAVIKFFAFLIKKNNSLKEAKLLERQGKTDECNAIVNLEVPDWARYVVGLSGAQVEITGQENIPQDTAVVFIGNHQGYLDIPVLLGYLNKPMAFIAKKELLKVPLLAEWMKLMKCTFLDRKNMRQSVRAIQDAIETVKEGYSLVIFPEGTRSRGDDMGEFKAGSFKLPVKAGAPIIPVTIDGTWHLLEEKGHITPATVRITVHPPVQTAGLSREETRALPEQVRKTIADELKKNGAAKFIKSIEV